MRPEKSHWESTYESKRQDEVSWFETSPEVSLAMIERADLVPDAAAVIDIGGGASRLAAALLDCGYSDITVADISATALELAQAELGERSGGVAWVEADVRDSDFGRQFDLWHDRAVLHFMVDGDDRDAYLQTLRRTLRPGGHLAVATFGADGPERCSGLPVQRYDTDGLQSLLGYDFTLCDEQIQLHSTPGGNEQQFQYALFRRAA